MDLFDLNRLPAAIAGRIRRRELAAGEALFRQGDAAEAVFVVERGRMALVRHAADGRPIILHVAEAGDSFAEAALFAEAYHCDGMAETPSRVAVLPKTALAAALAGDANLAAGLLARLARHVQALRTRLELRNIRGARERTWRTLLLAAGGGAGTVTFAQPLKTVAAEIGLTHEAFYRALAELEAEGLIRRARRRISILASKT
ncbi:MAG: Crp/Fnr family transcriptional regulator [Rhodospirillales bacterium]|nr:Crp/Fnr family transcriptional regulator [Rhodospirillales bacterium]